MAGRQVAVLGPLSSDVATRAFLACEVVEDAPRPDRPLVVVWIPDSVIEDPQRMAQLQRETALVTQLEHPNLARVYGLHAFEEGWARLVEYTDGQPLRRIVDALRDAGTALEPNVLGRIVCDICSAVHYAHEHGIAHAAGQPIVHGGLRPDTILVSFSGATYVTGYGASALAGAGLPVSSGNVDRRHYYAPEQILGGKAAAGIVTDVYGVGAISYELLTGRAPYRGTSDVEQAVLTGDLAVPMLSAPGEAMMNVALRALSRRGSDRFESVLELEEAVQDALRPDGIATELEVARLLARLFPEHAAGSSAQSMLLEVASDPDAATVLTLSRDLPDIPGPSTMPPFPSAPPAEADADSPSASDPAGFADTVPSPSATGRAEAPTDEEDDGALPVPSWVPEAAPEPLGGGDSGGSAECPGAPPRFEVDGGPADSTPWSAADVPGPAEAPSLASARGPAANDPGGDRAGESLAAALARPAGRPKSRRARPLISEITHFDQRTGDGSRYALVAILLVAAGILAFIVAFPKEPPEGLAEPASRTKLPPELVGAAMQRAEAAEDEAEPAAGPSGATGAAHLGAEPPVDVYRGREKLGRTPLTVALPVGTHELRLTDAEHRINAYRTVEVREGELTRLDVRFEQFELVLAGPHGADVFLNSKRVDRLPVRPLHLYEGEYLLEVRFDGERWSERIASRPGRRVEVAVEQTARGLERRTPEPD